MTASSADAGVVIVGGGLAGQRCAETLRRCGYDGRLRMLCAEHRRPYDRPPLSKELLGTPADAAAPFFRAPGWYAEQGVELLLGRRAARLDAHSRLVDLQDGRPIAYRQLLVATGSRPRRLAALEGFANVTYLRTLEDAWHLRRALRAGQRLAVVGAGFIGQEVAAAARAHGCPVTMIEAERVPLARVVGERVGRWLLDLHAQEGVEVLAGATVRRAYGSGTARALELDDGRLVGCDHVVVGIGVSPDLGWLVDSGLDACGVAVDGAGRTALVGVFAAGDAAAPYDPSLGRHAPGGHWESAARQGAAAARAMLDLNVPAPAPHSFWSDQYGVRIQQLGGTHLADRVTIEGDLDARDFMALYTRAGRPVAALPAGRPQDLPRARQLLADAQPPDHPLIDLDPRALAAAA